MPVSLSSRYRGCLLGLACGDAVGTTVEFMPRGTFEPLTDMVGGGPFHLPAGAWTDDTSMALCLAASLLECRGFNYDDQLKRYIGWWRDGEHSSIGRCFDIGSTTLKALAHFERTGKMFDRYDPDHGCGNGSLMRLAPVPLFWHLKAPCKRMTSESSLFFARESSRTTHAAPLCMAACHLFCSLILNALAGKDKDTVLGDHLPFFPLSEPIKAIAKGNYRSKAVEKIRGSGYVVDSLEAACWCFHHTDNFRDAVLTAANLGDDADTTAAVTGQLAGAFYGEEGIPLAWLARLFKHNKIAKTADRLLEASAQRP